ncbi:DNA-dependent protein kinase catalytic subunit-like [Aphidius gifuensis]|uniref:DNA-dependent protein kinase catalytic subunit-like n=1 Tax=Aphidius gifuensis TaxID=684658 RepID=UPI001CDBFF36|nr:DNA-dependent protein kinase catalytic subunit-like [Aphidius gifuensis]
MASIVCYNFNEICRLCLKQKKNNSPIYDDKKNLTLVNKIISIARIQIDENDNLPSLICHDCLQLVDKFHEFKLLIEISDRELRCCLKNKIIDNKIDVDKDDESTKEQIDYTIIVPTTQNYDDKCIETKEELTEQVDNGIVFMNDNDDDIDDVDDVDDVNCELCSEPVGTINDLKNHISEHFFKQDDANNSRQNINNNTDNDDEKNTTPTHTNDNDNDDNIEVYNRQYVVDEIIDTFIKLSTKLNLKIKTKNDHFDPALADVAENESDYRIFLNMIDLYDEILGFISPALWTNKMPEFLYKIIRASYKSPLISGFYQIANRVIQSSQIFDDFNDDDDTELFNSVLEYLLNAINKVDKYPLELQIVVIKLILQSPIIFVPHFIDRVDEIFKISFTIGLDDCDLANDTLDTLDRYMSTKNTLKYENIIKKILPSLNLYLKSKESLEINQDKLSLVGKRMQKNIDGFEKLQNRILLLFGKIDSSLMIEFLHNESQHTNASWDDKNLLEYSMTFPDGSLDVYLDTLLPRIIDLSLNSSDRRTKVAASEVLYSITAIILGKTVHFLASNPDRYSSFYKLLCPSLLKLGCDSDDVVKQLFNPLTFQITHWLSNRLMYNSPASYHLIDSLFDGLCDESNSLTRDFSGILLGEFAKWTIKQSSDRYILDKSNFINTIVRNIKNFSLHSWNHRRIAAAIGFNHLYKILRENEKVVDVYWLEFLYCFVKSMDGCLEKCIKNVLGHIERVLIEKSDIFLTTNKHRMVPYEFAGGTLIDAMNWLLIQCGKLHKNAVQYVMILFENLSSKIEYLISPKDVITRFIDTNGFQQFENIILGNLNNFTVKMTENYLNNLSNTLNLCIWLIQNNFIEANLLFSSLNPRNLVIFNCIKNLITSVDKMSLLQCETLIIALDFIAMILEIDIDNKKEAMKIIFQANLFSFATKCALVPQTVGFDMKNILLTEQLMSKLEKLFVIGKNCLVDGQMIMMMEQIDGEIKNNFSWCDAFSFYDIVSTFKNPIDIRVINGLILLQKCNCLDGLDLGYQINAEKSNKLKEIFKVLKYQNNDENKCMDIDEQNKQYLNNCLELFLHNQVPFVAVKKCILNKTKLLRYDNIVVSHGDYFFNTFHDVLIRCSLVNIDETIKALVDIIHTEADTVIFLLEAITLFLEHQKTKYHEEIKKFSHIVFCNFKNFYKMINSPVRANSFNNICRIIIQFLDNPSDVRHKYPEFYLWILNELSENSDLSEKTRIINDFIVCLTTENSEDDPRLLLILKMLKNHCKIRTQTEKNILESMKLTECFETLMKMLPITKTIIIFETAINFSLIIDKYSLNNTTLNHLNCYFNLISSSNALKSLNLVYQLFMSHHVSTERLNMLKNFIIPSFKACSSITIEKFFEQNIYELFKTINENSLDNPIDFENTVISKIGTYNILEYLFFKVDEKIVNKADGVISLNAFAGEGSTKQLTEQIFKTTLNVRKLNNSNTIINKEYMRLLHCAAYNCSIIITSKSSDSKYYLSLFAENAKRDQFIWSKIIDCNKQYVLSQTFKEYPKKRKEVLNFKASLKNNEKYHSADNSSSCIKNYNLTSSTLAEDIYEYDLSEAVVMKNSSDNGFLLSLEEDDLNNHECMYQICAILKHMIDNKFESIKTKPNWLDCFIGSMFSEHYNVRLFLLKVILNNQQIFKKVAERIIEPIIDIVIKILNEGNLNYIVTDCILVLVDWSDIAIPKNTGIQKANALFELFAEKIEAGTTTECIVRNNFNILDLLVKAWVDILEVPLALDKKIIDKPTRGIRIILIILSSNMAGKLIARQDVMDFLITYLEKNWRYNEEDVLRSCESIGLFLKASESIDNFGNYKTTIVDKLNTAFGAIREPTRLVKCINSVCNAYPIISKYFQEFVLRNHLKLAPLHKAKSMEVFYHMIPSMNDQEILQEMRHLKFNSLLNDKVLHCELICLKIIQRLVTILNAENYIPFAKLASGYSQHDNQEHRQITYQIFINVYKKYSKNNPIDCHEKILIDLSKEILLPGILETTESLKEMLIKFWTEEIQFSENCPDRIIDIFDIYSPSVEHDFLTFFGIIFLYLSRKSPDYDKKLFAPLDANCNQQNYNIVVSWRRKNLAHKIPLFANSYASQYTQRSTLSTMDNFIATNDGFMLRATQAPNFVDTFINDAVPETSENTTLPDEHVFKIPKTQFNNITSKRFTKSDDLKIKHKHIPDNYSRKEKIHRQVMKQRTDVKLNRTYRYGDFPDTEITHESILNPLQELIKKDKILCKNFIVSLINSVINRLASSRQQGVREKYQNFIENISKKLSLVLKNYRGNDLIIPAVFEILIYNENIKFDTNLIAHVATSAGLDSLGALLLEKKLLKEPDDEPPPLKRRRVVEPFDDSNKIDQWIQLAELYASVDDVDIFLSIFQNHIAGIELHKAAKLRAACKWNQALGAYELAQASETKAIKRHCQQEIYECLARLSNWDILTQRIDKDFGNNKNLKDFLDVAKLPDEGWVTPWYFQSQMYLYQNNPNDGNNQFFDQVNELKKHPDYKDILHELFSHELVFFWTLDSQEETKDLIRKASTKIREQWIQLSNFSLQLKIKQIIKLRGLANVDMITKVNKNLSNIDEVLLRYWSHSHPTQHDDLLSWDIHLNHRLNFGRLLKHEMQHRDDNSQQDNLADAIDESIIKQLLSMSDAALKQKNLGLTSRCFDNVEYYEKTKEFKSEFILKKAEAGLQEAICDKENIQGYFKAWKRCRTILKIPGDSLKRHVKISTLHLLSDISLSLKEFSVENQQDARRILEKIGEINDYDIYSLEKLKEACNIAEDYGVDDNEIANCHLKILKYCYMKIIDGDVSLELLKNFVKSTLKAMACGSQEAGQYFPCLLKSKYLNDQEVINIFKEGCMNISSWRFLPWQPQLLFHLSSNLESIISPIITRLVQDYPNALVYSFHVLSDTNPDLEDSIPFLRIKQLLSCQKVEKFIEAMNYLVRPELYLEYHLKDLLENLHLGTYTVVDRLKKKIYQNNDTDIHGNLYKTIVNKYRNDIELIKDMEIDNIKNHVYKIMTDLKRSLLTKANSEYLEDYSPWLNNFTCSELEIPGQYTGYKKPLPKYHAKITKIESKIQVMTSLRRPIKITMVGNDAKNYNFLVKFGEDLGLDEIIEQVFVTMNDILKSNSACSQRHLSIDTYKVIPFSGSLGLIQWIDGTKTLQDYINFSASNSEKNELEMVLREYEEWIHQASPDSVNIVTQYKEALFKYDAEDVIDKMNSLINRTNSNLIRRTFVKINSTLEGFMFAKKNFIITYAIMCAAQWILGIGDRHLKNILISIDSGRCIGIDFNSAFGGGIDQSVPELVPFRLTNQITSLMKPFNEHDLFAMTMIHVIKALRDGKGPILASIDGIAHHKLSKVESTQQLVKSDSDEWFSDKKINVVLKKLNGGKPSMITLEELEIKHRDKYWNRYQNIVEGFHCDAVRLKMNDETSMSPENQVQCLLEQATDLNILGRAYGPWMPWL